MKRLAALASPLPRLRSRRVVGALIAGIVGLAILPAAPAGAADPVLHVDQARVDELVSLADADPATFGGVSLNEASGTVTVRYANGQGQAAARSRLGGVASLSATRGAGRWRVDLVPVRHSVAKLDDVRQKMADAPAWRPVMSEWYVDITRNVVAVGVTSLSPKLTAAAQAEFGDLVRLYEAARPSRASRTDDWAPWGGGIRINSGGFGCTSGFAIEVPGTPASRKMLTAGHCFALGATVTNNGEVVGTVSSRTLAQNGKDVETINGNFMGWTYKGPPTSEYGDTIQGAKASVVGQTFCTNGATSGEVCSGTVNAKNICVTFSDGITTCQLDRLGGNVTLVRSGDSGGNIFAYDAAGLKVGGIIIGGSGGTVYFHPASAVVPMGWRVTVG
jgi:hypothetical protein